jgi:hypothetical protein
VCHGQVFIHLTDRHIGQETAMTQRLIALFGHIEGDGSLKKVTFPQAYELATRSLPNTSIPETFQLLHDRALRRFAKEQMVGNDRGYFLHTAGVPLHESPHAADYAQLCVAEVIDALYAEDPDPARFARELGELLHNMSVQPEGRVPDSNELVLDDEIELLPLRAY